MDDDIAERADDHDRLTRLLERSRQLEARVAFLEQEQRAIGRVVTGWRGGIAVMIFLGGILGWLASHVGELVMRGGK